VRILIKAAALLLALAASSACSSGWVDLSPVPPAGYTNLGPAEGEACATHLLALPWHQLFAIGASDRLQRAREAAIASVPGATGLVDVTLQERWSYWGLFSRRCAIVRGDGIR
jgi:hypothetical protein